MTTKEAYQTVLALIEGEQQFITPFLLGKPGIGKSYIVHKLKEDLGLKYIIDLRLSQHDETDFKIPEKKNGFVTWLTSDFIPTEDNPKYDGPGILFLDELNRASQQTMQAVFQIVLDRAIGTKKIRDDWKIVAAGNLGHEDKTFVNEMDTALKNRFAFVEIDQVNLDEFLEEEKQLSKYVKGFLQKQPSKLYVDDHQYLITPRTWTKFSQYLNQYKGNNIREYALTIGKALIPAAIAAFNAYLSDFRKLSPKDILDNLDKFHDVLKEYERGDIHSLNTELCEYLKDADITKKQIINLDKYFNTYLLDDNRMFITKKLLENNKNILKKWIQVFPEYDDEDSEFNRIVREVL